MAGQRSINSYFNQYGAFFNDAPKQPTYEASCHVNEKIQTIPEGFPMTTEVWGPTSLKHLYTAVPNYYPVQKQTRPYGSMYDSDLSQFDEYGRRQSYQYQIDPFHHRNVKEILHYQKANGGQAFLPIPSTRQMVAYPLNS
jgi:hypothetical protein